jgi:HK97 gp10 family phage protein
MSGTVEFRITNNKLPQMVDGVDELARSILTDVLDAIVAGCQARSRVDTGEMQAGWTIEQRSAMSYAVTNPVEHTVYNEFGTIHMPAQPMLTPSVEEQRQAFIDAWGRIAELAK